MESKPKVKLIAFTSEPDLVVARAARLCYSQLGIEELFEKMDKEKCRELVKRIVKLGHYSVLEHAGFTFAVEGVSRALTHQLVRHRIASYSQQSQRYVDAEKFNYIIPETIKSNNEFREKFEDFMAQSKKLYNEFRESVPKEDARFVLPNAMDSKIIVSMNARSLYNFFEKRCCTRAQWEIRNLAGKMLEEVRKVAPLIFEKAGASCESRGFCPEGEMSCGKWKTLGAVLLGK